MLATLVSLTHATAAISLRPTLPLASASTRSFRSSTVLASAYYETIDGLKYDSSALEAARAAVAGKGDGRVSKSDSEAILATLLDGGGVTATE